MSGSIKNILYINDIFDFDNNKVKRFAQLQNEFGLSSHECLNYHKIIASIPKALFLRLNVQPNQNDTEHVTLYQTLTEKEQSYVCRYMTNFQVKHFYQYRKTKITGKMGIDFPRNNFAVEKYLHEGI